MDFNSLRDQVTNLSLYDLKAGVRKVQNAVMNYTEMEAKVREATNNEPWGTSTSAQNEIASGTFNYQLLNEIMPMIYKRFTEKSAEEWRQIYKALQLLEFLIKHGSERVIDDARSHLSLLKMLKQFHYIDQNGKDQGINVRNRSKELTELLGDVDRIRAERKKARTTRGKYGGVEGGGGLGGSSSQSSSGQYGGFGSEQAGYGGYSGGVFGDGGGFGGSTAEEYDTGSRTRSERFDEYDEYDEGATAAPGRRKQDATRTPTSVNRNKKQPEPPKPKEPEVDLFSFGDDEPTAAPAPAFSNGKAPATAPVGDFGGFQAGGADDDDFDDFQSAAPTLTSSTQIAPARAAMPSLGFLPPPTSTSTPSATTNYAAPQPLQAGKSADFSNIFSTTSPAPGATAAPAIASPALAPTTSRPTPSGYQAAAPNYFTSVSLQSNAGTPTAGGVKSPTGGVTSSAASVGGGQKSKAGGDAFANLLGGSGLKSKNAAGQGAGMSMQEMAKQKASAGLWGAPASAGGGQSQVQQKQGQAKTIGGGGGALDDLLG